MLAIATSSRLSRAAIAGGAALALAGAALLFLFDPATSRLYPSCPLHSLTGLLCPGCGTLRSLNRLLNGDLAGAFSMNAAAVIAFPLLAYYGLSLFRTSRAAPGL